MSHFQGMARFIVLLIALAVVLAGPAVIAAPHRPPTVDPTYGLPLPSPSKAPAVAVPQWIWAAGTTDNQSISLRRAFALNSVPKKATVYLTADDFFTLFVNGTQVNQSRPDPKDDSVWQHVHAVEVARYLHAGNNVLAVRATNAGGAAGFVAQLNLPGQRPIVTDAQWKVSGEATLPEDWTASDYDDGAWPAATVIAPLTGGVWASASGLPDWPGYQSATVPYLAHLTLPFMRVTEVHPGEGKITGASGLVGHANAVLTVMPSKSAADPPSLLLDVGKEIAGRVVIAPLTGGTVEAATGESDDEARKSPWGGPHRLLLSPGTTAATPYSAFRYVRLVFTSEVQPVSKVVRLRVSVDHKYYPVQYKGRFDCSDLLLTKLWYTGAYTAHLCMQENIWDAPKRDRARWVGDLHISGEVINTVFADKFLMEQTLTRLRDDAQGGRPAMDLPRTHVNDIPGYSCAWICCLADFHRHLGDYAYLNRQHDLLLSLLDYMRGDLDERGLFANTHGKWPFVDWSPNYNGDDPQARAATDLFYVKAVREAVFLLREMGDTASADRCSNWVDTLTAAARQYLPDSKTQTYGNRLQKNAMAVYSGIATPAQRAAIYSAILTPNSPAWDKSGALLGNHPVLSPYYGNYVIYAMSQCGHNADTLRVLHDYWGGMLAEGATTFWEGYDPKWPKTHFHEFLQADNNTGTSASLCHGWSAGPTSWLTERVLGVRPTGGGFKTTEIMPDLGGLAWASGAVPTPHGLLQIRVVRKAGAMTLTLTVPPGVNASVGLPGLAVTVNGHPAKSGHWAAGRLIVPLKAGQYTLISQ